MNKLTKTLFFAISVLFFITQVRAQDAPNVTDMAGKKQGHWIKYDENKKKIYDGNFADNIPEGKFIYYSSIGTPKAITFFSGNGKIARTQHFNINGKIAGEGKYIDQKIDSIWKFYNDAGLLLSVELYSDGAKNGSCKVYYPNGQISEDKMFLNGRPNGNCTKYFESGTIKYKGQTIIDKAEGKTTFYFSNGKVNAEGYYKNDLKDGSWKFYNQDGTLKKTVLYVNGVTNDKSELNIINKEEEEKARKQYEQNDIKDPFKDGSEPK